MGARDTLRGLGRMTKGCGCLLIICTVTVLVPFLLLKGVDALLAVCEFVYNDHWEIFCWTIGILVLLVLISIVLALANAIGKESD